jgi:hypothetical protein
MFTFTIAMTDTTNLLNLLNSTTSDVERDLLMADRIDGYISASEEMSETTEVFDVSEGRDSPSTPMTISSGDETPALTEELEYHIDQNLIHPIKLEDLFDLEDSTNATETSPEQPVQTKESRQTLPPQNPEYNRLENLPYEIVERPRSPLSLH